MHVYLVTDNRASKTDNSYHQTSRWHRQLFKYNRVISSLMQDKHISIWAYYMIWKLQKTKCRETLSITLAHKRHKNRDVTWRRCNHKLNKCPKDVYVKFVSASAPGTVYTCMNSWKEPFNTYNSSIWISSLFWLLNWFQACFQMDTIVVSRQQPPYCLCKKSSSSYERIKNKQVTVLLSNQKARKRYTLML